jgi:hypothetical protein
LPEFEPNPERFAVDFDRSRVHALQEDDNLRAARWNSQVAAGYVMVGEARRAFNLPVTPADEVFLRPLSVVEVGSRSSGGKATPSLTVVKRGPRRLVPPARWRRIRHGVRVAHRHRPKCHLV